jgi:hypothetical protein
MKLPLSLYSFGRPCQFTTFYNRLRRLDTLGRRGLYSLKGSEAMERQEWLRNV